MGFQTAHLGRTVGGWTSVGVALEDDSRVRARSGCSCISGRSVHVRDWTADLLMVQRWAEWEELPGGVFPRRLILQ